MPIKLLPQAAQDAMRFRNVFDRIGVLLWFGVRAWSLWCHVSPDDHLRLVPLRLKTESCTKTTNPQLTSAFVLHSERIGGKLCAA